MIRLVFAVLLLIVFMACDAAPTPTPYPTNTPRTPVENTSWMTPTPRTPTPTPSAEQMAEQVRESRQRTSQLCSTAEEGRKRYRSMADEALAYSDRVMRDNVITEPEGEQLREYGVRLEREAQRISTAERRCDDAKQQLRALEDALRRMPRPTATPTLTPTQYPTSMQTATPTPWSDKGVPTGRTPTPRPTSTPTPTPTVTPTPSPTPSGPILPQWECWANIQEHWDAVAPTIVQEVARGFLSGKIRNSFQLTMGGGERFRVYTDFSDYPRGRYWHARHGIDIPVPHWVGTLAIVDWAGSRADDFSSFWEIEALAHYDPWTCLPLKDQGEWIFGDDALQKPDLIHGMWVKVSTTRDYYEEEAAQQERPAPIRFVPEPTQ